MTYIITMEVPGEVEQLAPRRRRARIVGEVAGPLPEADIGVARSAEGDWEQAPQRIQRQRYFPTGGAQRKYYGIKRMINFQNRFPLREWWYKPVQRGTLESLSDMGASYRLASARQRQNRASYLMSGRGLYRGRKYTKGKGGFFGGLAGLLSGQGWQKGSDMGDRIWDMGGKKIAEYVPGLNKVVEVTDSLNPLAGQLAKMAGKGLYKRGRGLYRGRGEYIATNGLVQGPSIVPQFGQDDMKTTTITNREYVCDVFAPAANTPFAPQEYPLNPGMSKLFAWLSQIAINYEEYAIKQLIITYKSTVADFASQSGQVGQVIMATQYNPTSDPFGSKEEMMLYEGGMSCKTTEHMQHGVECDPKKLSGTEYKYIRVGNLPLTEDLKEYDLGRLCMAITGTPSTYANQIIGELWVSYTVVLRKPKVASGHAYNIKRDVALVPAWTNVGSPSPAPATSLLLGTRNTGAVTFIVPTSVQLANAALDYDRLLEDVPTKNVADANNLTKQLTISFADDFEGCVEIKFRKFSNVQLTGPEIPFLLLSSDDVGTTAEHPPTISRFKDIPLMKAALQTRVWGHVYTTSDPYASQGSSAETSSAGAANHSPELVLHVRLQPPVSGKKNEISVYYNIAANSSNYWTCEVNQFNTFLSSTDNGRGPANLLLQDVSGNPYYWA